MKSPTLTQDIYDYLVSHSTFSGDPLLQALQDETAERFGDDSVMQISELQGLFLSFLVKISNTKNVLEIGTFTGYSSLCIARSLPTDGHLTCLDISHEWTGIAKKYWDRAGVSNRVELIIGPAIESLRTLSSPKPFDLVFIDAEKTEYREYYEGVLPRLKSGGLIVFDNMLRGGGVVQHEKDPGTEAIHQLNSELAVDNRVETVMLPIADGIQVCRKT